MVIKPRFFSILQTIDGLTKTDILRPRRSTRSESDFFGNALEKKRGIAIFSPKYLYFRF